MRYKYVLCVCQVPQGQILAQFENFLCVRTMEALRRAQEALTQDDIVEQTAKALHGGQCCSALARTDRIGQKWAIRVQFCLFCAEFYTLFIQLNLVKSSTYGVFGSKKTRHWKKRSGNGERGFQSGVPVG